MKTSNRLSFVLALVAMALPSFAQNRVSFAGEYNAIAYAYGLSGSSAPLIVDIGTTATGVGTLTLAKGSTALGDGTSIAPLSTNAPILVGNGPNQELVTPSAVSCNTPNVVDTCTFTASFANVHGAGDQVVSGTYGLQEAINAASAGGVVLVDAKWTQAGGTSTILAAAALGSTGAVAIRDNRNSQGQIQTVTVLIPNAAVKTLFSVGSTLLPAPGAGVAYDIQDIVFENSFLTAAFAAGGAIQASYGTGVTVPASATVAATFLTSPAASQMIKVSGALASSLSSVVANKAITLAAATADFTTGGGSLIVKISYRLITGL